jgi:hypothetical protein
MKFALGTRQTKPLNEIKTALREKFKNPKLESQCIIELNKIKKKVIDLVWEFDQRFKTLTGHLIFHILD